MQLRLVDGLPERERVPVPVKARRARMSKGARGRAVHWAEWHLDARTKRVGRAGVAAARAALERADRPEPGTPLSKAS